MTPTYILQPYKVQNTILKSFMRPHTESKNYRFVQKMSFSNNCLPLWFCVVTDSFSELPVKDKNNFINLSQILKIISYLSFIYTDSECIQWLQIHQLHILIYFYQHLTAKTWEYGFIFSFPVMYLLRYQIDKKKLIFGLTNKVCQFWLQLFGPIISYYGSVSI